MKSCMPDDTTDWGSRSHSLLHVPSRETVVSWQRCRRLARPVGGFPYDPVSAAHVP